MKLWWYNLFCLVISPAHISEISQTQKVIADSSNGSLEEAKQNGVFATLFFIETKDKIWSLFAYSKLDSTFLFKKWFSE